MSNYIILLKDKNISRWKKGEEEGTFNLDEPGYGQLHIVAESYTIGSERELRIYTSTKHSLLTPILVINRDEWRAIIDRKFLDSISRFDGFKDQL